MGRRFLGGTKHYEFEMMMQELPHINYCRREDKKLKRTYFKILNNFLDEKGYGDIKSRVLTIIRKMYFEEFCFNSEEHENTFAIAHGRLISLGYGNDKDKLAVIYLLSADDKLSTILCDYLRGKCFDLPQKVGNVGEKGYNLFRMARKIIGEENMLDDADFLEPDIIENDVLCLMINSLMLQEYGLKGFFSESEKNKKVYSDNQKHHNSRYMKYTYGNQVLTVKM